MGWWRRRRSSPSCLSLSNNCDPLSRRRDAYALERDRRRKEVVVNLADRCPGTRAQKHARAVHILYAVNHRARTTRVLCMCVCVYAPGAFSANSLAGEKKKHPKNEGKAPMWRGPRAQ